MNGRSRSSLFLIEQLIVIAVFAVCAAACVSIFVDAFLTAEGTDDINHALIAAKSGAECYKAYGNLEETAEILEGVYSPDATYAVVYYDGDWRVCGETEAVYTMRFESADAGGLTAPLLCELSVEKITGEEIISFTVAAGGGTRNE